MKPALSLIIPANNEATFIRACLQAVLSSSAVQNDAIVQVIVVANGCTDETAQLARDFVEDFQSRGWQLEVMELEQGSKITALNLGENAATADVLAYLDADVIVSSQLLAQTVDALSRQFPAYASGKVHLMPAKTATTRGYGSFYLQTPFMKQKAPGCGYFAMNRVGRARWNEWPKIISDDTFARLKFANHERFQVDASYDWPLVEGLRNLVKVRRRQNAGVDELSEKHPDLLDNDSKQRFALSSAFKAALSSPFGAIIYGTVSLTVKVTPGKNSDWKRGR